MLHAALALAVSALGLLAMLLHRLLNRRERSAEPATPSAMPSAAEMPQRALVTRRKNLRLWVSLRQSQRVPR